MSSSKKRRTKEDTWRADELEKSIKNALSDSSEKKHRRDRSKKQIKEEWKKEETDAEVVTTEKHSKENRSHRSRDRNHETVDYDKARSPNREGKNHLQDVDRPERTEVKGKQKSRTDDSTKKIREEKTKKHHTVKEERHQHKSKRRESQKESRHRDTDEKSQESETRGKHEESRSEEGFHYQDKGSLNNLPKREVHVAGDKAIQEARAYTPEDVDVYEDDFEEYEDDFEDATGHDDSENNELDSSEMAALRIAMEEENDATFRKSQGKLSTSSKSSASSRPATTRSKQTFINFTAAKQRQISTKVSQKAMQRGRELMNLIELDVSSCSLFEMPPVKVYEVYIKSYGRSNTKQACVQCHDDILERDIQTEPIETRDILIQHPSDGTSSVIDENQDSSVNKMERALLQLNSLRLSTFLEKAGQVMNTLLEESVSDGSKRHLQSNQRSILFSEGYTKLNSDLPFLKGRYVTHAQFHPVQTNLLLTVYSRPKVISTHDDSNSTQDILCVWNVNNSSQPYRILTCKSEVTCCCFSPTKSTFAFAGTVDGAILVWDLREPSSMHQSYGHVDRKWTLRVPTYSTYGAHRDENHHSTVAKLQPVTTADDSLRASVPNAGLTKKSEEMYGLSFQLASLDDQGVIHFWVVIDMDQTDTAGSETDLGLVPGGKVKLLKSSSITLENPCRNMSQATCKDMKFSLKHPNQFYVATDSGSILHGSRHGDRVSPRCYARQTDAADEVIQLDFSPFGLPCFLAASSDCSIHLYSLALESPLITWCNSTSNMPIVSISWSRSRPSVFYVVDVTSKVYVWELLASHGGPVKTEQFTNGRLVTMELSNDHTATGRGMQGRMPAMVIADDKGAVDVHILNQHFSVASTDELEQMAGFLNAFK